MIFIQKDFFGLVELEIFQVFFVDLKFGVVGSVFIIVLLGIIFNCDVLFIMLILVDIMDVDLDLVFW